MGSAAPPANAPADAAKTRLADDPGAKTGLAMTMSNGKLMLAGRVYDVPAIARHFKLTPASKCWPVLLSTKAGPAAMSLCPFHTTAEHANINTTMHTPPIGWDLAAVSRQFSVPGTVAERKQCGIAGGSYTPGAKRPRSA